MLRHIAGTQVRDIQTAAVHMADGSAVGQFTQESPDERGLAGAVLADENGELTAVDMHGHILEQNLPAAADGNPVQIDVAESTAVHVHGRDASLKFGD